MRSLRVSLPFLAKELAGNGVRNLGYLETMMGLGLILGSLYISLKHKEGIRDFFLFLFTMGVGVCYLLIGVFKAINIVKLVPYLILMLLIGAAIANASIYWQSLLQTNTPNDKAGRIFSISTMMGNISMPLAFGLFGLLLKFSSIMLLMSLSGISLVMFSILLLVGYRRAGFR